MLKAGASPSPYRMFGFRLRSRHLVSIVIVFVIFQIFEFGGKIPLGWNSSPKSILRPFDYIDRSTPRAPDPADEVIPDEDILAITHDKRNDNFYLGGTLTLTSQTDSQKSHPSPYIYDPYPNYNSLEWRRNWKGEFKPCLGPQQRNLDRTRAADMVQVYKGKQKEFPLPSFGSYEAIGLDNNVCADRYGRYGAYGHDDESSTEVPGFSRPVATLWDEVNWGKLQRQCFERNMNRYLPETATQTGPHLKLPYEPPVTPKERSDRTQSGDPKSSRHHSRSAVIIRGWHTMDWTPNDFNYLRSLIMELSLHSGGEYEVFLMVHVLDDSIPIATDADIQRLKEAIIPNEFYDMTVFFNNEMLRNWYPKIDEHKAIYQHFQPVQIFSQTFSDFDYYWQFEMDSRNFGHVYHFLDKAVNFAKEQPRKYLWERNAYFYTPGVHGSWSDFSNMVANNVRGKQTVWGPVPPAGYQPIGPTPPVATPEEDAFQWGVGEEADLITFLPIFDSLDSKWGFREIIYGFPEETRATIPRRTSVITMSRTSRALLTTMHDSLFIDGQAVVSEMSPATWALFHGLKAVHVPHPVYVDGHWNPKELDRIYNRGPPEKISGTPESIWEYGIITRIMYRISYMYSSQSSEDLFRRWLGYKPSVTQYTDGTRHKDADGLYWYDGGILREDVYGRLCFPPIFVHPVKNTEEALGPSRSVHGFDD